MSQEGAKNVLVVDDSATMRRMVMASLRTLNVSFQEASNGLDAIERLTLGPIDLMILDLNMPDMHGMEVLQFAKGHSAFRAIPIIMLTTRGDEESRSAALAAGASLYLTKPYDPAALSEQARKLLNLD
jgi:two-component system, chemotaxis family, chemotaxis protein CheY